MSGLMHGEKQTAFRNRLKPIKRWLHSEEIALINFLKQNPDFEKPVCRIYYNKFLAETRVNADWNHVRSKVRNMRCAYRRAKEYEINKKYTKGSDCNDEAVKREMLKIFYYIDDFDVIFPNEMDSFIYKDPQVSTTDDDFSNEASTFNTNNSSKMFNKMKCLQEEETTSSSSKSIDEDMLTVKKNMFHLKRRKHNNDTNLKRRELELAKEKLYFEKEKFHQEIKIKEKEIESHERLKVMELQMKERLAMKELELKEKLGLKSIEKQEISYNNSYHNLS